MDLWYYELPLTFNEKEIKKLDNGETITINEEVGGLVITVRRDGLKGDEEDEEPQEELEWDDLTDEGKKLVATLTYKTGV